MHKLTKAIKQKRFEAICRELNDLVNSLHLPKEISVAYNFDYYPNYKNINIHFYKWAVTNYDPSESIIDSIWFAASTQLPNFNKKINAMRNALIAFKKGEFVWSEQAAIAEQTH